MVYTPASLNTVYDSNGKPIIKISTNYNEDQLETFYGNDNTSESLVIYNDDGSKLSFNTLTNKWGDSNVTTDNLKKVYATLKKTLDNADCTWDTRSEAYALAETAMKILTDDAVNNLTEERESISMATNSEAQRLKREREATETLSVIKLAEDVGEGIRTVPVLGPRLVDGLKKIKDAIGADTIARKLARKPLKLRWEQWKNKEGNTLIDNAGFHNYSPWKNSDAHATSGPVSLATFRKIANGGAVLLTKDEFKHSDDMKNAFSIGREFETLSRDQTSIITEEFNIEEAYETYKSMHNAAVVTTMDKVTEFSQEGLRILQRPVSETFEETFKKFNKQYPGQQSTVVDGKARDYLRKVYNQASVPNFYDFSHSEEYADARTLFNFDDKDKVTKQEYDRYVQYAGTGNPILANRAARAAFETVKGAGEGILDDFMDTLSGNFDKIGKRRERPQYEQFKADMGIYNLSEEQLAALYTQTEDLDVTFLANRDSYQANMGEAGFPKGVPYNIARMYNKQSDMWQNTPNVYGSDAKDVVSKYKNKEGFSDVMEEIYKVVQQTTTDAATKKANIEAKLIEELKVSSEEATKAAEEFVDGLDYNQPYEFLPDFMTQAGLKTALSSEETEDLEKWLGGVGKDAVTLSFAAFGVNTADLYSNDGKIDRDKALDALKKQAVLRAAFPTFAANRDMVSGTMTALGTYLGTFKQSDGNGNITIDTDKLASWTKSSLFIADVISFSGLALPFIAKGYEALLWARDSLYMPLEPYPVPDLIVTPLRNLSRADEARWAVQAWRQDIVRVTNSLLENVEKTTEASQGILDASSIPGQSNVELEAIRICNGEYDPLRECAEVVPDWVRRLQRLPRNRIRQTISPALWGQKGAIFNVNGVNILGKNEIYELDQFKKTLKSLVTETTFRESDNFKGSYYQEILVAVLLSTPKIGVNGDGVEVRYIANSLPVEVKTKTIYKIPDPNW